MPSKDTQPLFDEAKRLKVGFYLGYAEMIEEGEILPLQDVYLVLPDWTHLRKVPQSPSAGPRRSKTGTPFQHLEKRYFEVGNLEVPCLRDHGGHRDGDLQ